MNDDGTYFPPLMEVQSLTKFKLSYYSHYHIVTEQYIVVFRANSKDKVFKKLAVRVCVNE